MGRKYYKSYSKYGKYGYYKKYYKRSHEAEKEMSGSMDYHAHFVYGVDDGAQTREEMYAMLDAAGV